jgi:hypothetical protein
MTNPRRALDPRRFLPGAASDERPPFVEGLVLGAVIGAAIAGSTLWSRVRAGRRRAAERSIAKSAEPSEPALP